MNAYCRINDFLGTLYCNEQAKRRKKNALIKFCFYLENNFNFKDSNWDFSSVKSVKYGDKIIYMPIDTKIVSDYMSSISSEVTPMVYNNILSILRQFFSFMVDIEVIPSNPASKLKPTKLIKRDMSQRVITYNDAVKLLQSAVMLNEHKNRNFTLVLTLLSSAIRVGELVKMTESDLRMEESIAFVKGKSGARQRMLTPGLIDSLKKLINDPLRIKAISGFDNFIFYSDEGGPLNTNQVNFIIKDIAVNAGITSNITSYWLRRTHATVLAQSGFSLVEIQYLFDHDRIKNTDMYVITKQREEIREMVNSSTVVAMLEKVVRSEIKPVR